MVPVGMMGILDIAKLRVSQHAFIWRSPHTVYRASMEIYHNALYHRTRLTKHTHSSLTLGFWLVVLVLLFFVLTIEHTPTYYPFQ